MTPPHLAIRSRGATCPRRGIPLVDVYLSGTGGPQGTAEGMWMWQGGISIPFAEAIASWFESAGVKAVAKFSIART